MTKFLMKYYPISLSSRILISNITRYLCVLFFLTVIAGKFCDLGPSDIIFLVHASHDIDGDEFDEVKSFLANFVDDIDTGYANTQVKIGVVLFDNINEAEYRIKFADFDDKLSIQLAVKDLERLPCGYSWCRNKQRIDSRKAIDFSLQILNERKTKNRMRKLVLILRGNLMPQNEEYIQRVLVLDPLLRIAKIYIIPGWRGMNTSYEQYLQEYNRYKERSNQIYNMIERKPIPTSGPFLKYSKRVEGRTIILCSYEILCTIHHDLCNILFGCLPCEKSEQIVQLNDLGTSTMLPLNSPRSIGRPNRPRNLYPKRNTGKNATDSRRHRKDSLEDEFTIFKYNETDKLKRSTKDDLSSISHRINSPFFLKYLERLLNITTDPDYFLDKRSIKMQKIRKKRQSYRKYPILHQKLCVCPHYDNDEDQSKTNSSIIKKSDPQKITNISKNNKYYTDIRNGIDIAQFGLIIGEKIPTNYNPKFVGEKIRIWNDENYRNSMKKWLGSYSGEIEVMKLLTFKEDHSRELKKRNENELSDDDSDLLNSMELFMPNKLREFPTILNQTILENHFSGNYIETVKRPRKFNALKTTFAKKKIDSISKKEFSVQSERNFIERPLETLIVNRDPENNISRALTPPSLPIETDFTDAFFFDDITSHKNFSIIRRNRSIPFDKLINRTDYLAISHPCIKSCKWYYGMQIVIIIDDSQQIDMRSFLQLREFLKKILHVIKRNNINCSHESGLTVIKNHADGSVYVYISHYSLMDYEQEFALISNMPYSGCDLANRKCSNALADALVLATNLESEIFKGERIILIASNRTRQQMNKIYNYLYKAYKFARLKKIEIRALNLRNLTDTESLICTENHIQNNGSNDFMNFFRINTRN